MKLTGFVGCAFLFVPFTAHANMILQVGPAYGSTEFTGASAEVGVSFARVGNDDRMTLQIENTTSPWLGSKLTALGLELPDYGWTVNFATNGKGRYFTRINSNVGVSPCWMNAPCGYDLMLTSDGKFEGGSAQGAPSAGKSETVVLSLGNTGLSIDQLAATFSSFYSDFAGRYVIARFQSVGPCGAWSDKVGGVATPEPGALCLLAVGGLLIRRRQHC